MNWMVWVALISGYSVVGLMFARRMANDSYERKKDRDYSEEWPFGMGALGFFLWPLILSGVLIWLAFKSKPIKGFFLPSAVKDEQEEKLKEFMLAKADKMVNQGKEMQRAGEIEIAQTLKDASDGIYKQYGVEAPYMMNPIFMDRNLAKYYNDEGQKLPFGFLD